MLQVRNVGLKFGGVVALDDASLTVEPGMTCGLIGPNGAGKTTLFNCITRLYQPDNGSIEFDNVDLLALRPQQIIRNGIGRTFQNLGLFSGQTVRENLATGAYSTSVGGFMSAAVSLPHHRRSERRVRAKADQVMELLGLGEFADLMATELPYGIQKRVELGRILMCEPRLLMLDEPASGLNHEEVEDFKDLLTQIKSSESLSVLLVEHHMNLVMALSDHLVVLDHGRVIATGTPSQVQNDPAVIEAYLGASA